MKLPSGTKVEIIVGRFVTHWEYHYSPSDGCKVWDWIVPSGMFATSEERDFEMAIEFAKDTKKDLSDPKFPWKVEAALDIVQAQMSRQDDLFASVDQLWDHPNWRPAP